MVQRLGFIAFTDTAGVRLPVGEHFYNFYNCSVCSCSFKIILFAVGGAKMKTRYCYKGSGSNL